MPKLTAEQSKRCMPPLGLLLAIALFLFTGPGIAHAHGGQIGASATAPSAIQQVLVSATAAQSVGHCAGGLDCSKALGTAPVPAARVLSRFLTPNCRPDSALSGWFGLLDPPPPRFLAVDALN